MRKLTTLLLSLLIVTFTFGKSVTMEKASQVAKNYFAAYSGKTNYTIESSFSKSYEGTTTYYVFNFTGGGFVVVSADDVAVPVLGQSNEGFIEFEISNPNAKFWFDNYSKEIAHLIASDADNSESLVEWNRILNNDIDAPTLDVGPLCTTTWDQGQYYNYYCPTASGGPGGKAWAGCVATAMGQVMKFHNFPAKGVGSHTYTHVPFGPQTANFGTTNYNFASMGTSANAGSYQEIATLLYHAGVGVNMDYSAAGSGAFSADVPWVMGSYFNYDLSTIKFALKDDYTNTTWTNLLKAELDASRPVYYSGTDPNNGGHAWVCDGYRTSDNKYHMNWGWSGSSNGYFAVTTTSIVAGGFTFKTGFGVVYGIKPGNTSLIARLTDLNENNWIKHGPDFNIHCSVDVGSPTSVKLFIDNQLVYTTSQSNFDYLWQTSSVAFGLHTIRVEATDGTNAVFHQVNAKVTEWKPQASGFLTSARGIGYIHAVDSSLVWASAYDGSGGAKVTNEYTKTTNGGDTWTQGQVIGGATYGLGNICGVDANTAFAAVYNGVTGQPQNNTCGVYKTTNGGSTWTHMVGALQGSTSFADNVWFWNANEGMCHGDVKDNYFEIYTTTNGGTTWTRVPKANVGGGVNALSGEGGWTSVIDVVGNTVMFGTNKGNLYISHDKGFNWTISNTGITPITDGINKIAFKDNLNGVVAQTNTTVVFKETHDGGATWQTINPTGPFLTSDIKYVPGTDNTYVTTGAATGFTGVSYSFDGGYTWAQAGGTEIDQFTALDFVNNHCGWAGAFNRNAYTEGIYKFVGLLDPNAILSPVTNLIAQPLENSVHLTWTEPSTAPLSYNVYRNDTLIVNTPSLQYHDAPVANGQQNYCVTAVYDLGESPKTCTIAWITVGIPNTDDAAYRVYPNPANEIINVVAPVKFTEVRMVNSLGKIVYRNANKNTNLHILTEGFEPGMYILQIYTGTQVISKKVSISR